MPSDRPSFISRLISGARSLMYMATRTNQRRSTRFIIPNYRSEDEIARMDRPRMLALVRNLVRNFSIVAWAVRQHCIYVSSHTPGVRGVPPDIKRDILSSLRQWMLPFNFDVSQRYGLTDFLYLCEYLRTMDGDVLIYSTDDASSMIIESDRLVSFPEVEKEYEESIRSGTVIYESGVLLNRNGAPLGYSIGQRTNNHIVFDSVLPAYSCNLLTYANRYDQIRGISPLLSAASVFQDLFESIDYEITKHKIAQLFGIKIIHSNPPFFTSGESSEEEGPSYNVDFGSGPYLIDLQPGDDIQVVESSHPSATSGDFYKLLIMISLKALDIPYCFFDESATNYSSGRLAWLRYAASVNQRRQAIQQLLNWLTTRWLRFMIESKRLPEAAYDAEITWTPIGQPWLDPLKEVEADSRALALGVTSRQEIARRHGREYTDILEELIEEEQLLGPLINRHEVNIPEE